MKLLEKYKSPAIIVAVVVILGSIYAIAKQAGSGAPKRLSYGYYFQIDSGKLIVDEFTPRWSLNGGKAVRAMVYSCGECANADARFIGWLQTYPDADAIDMVVAAVPAAGGKPVWAPMDSDQGVMITESIHSRCQSQGKGLMSCAPLDSELP